MSPKSRVVLQRPPGSFLWHVLTEFSVFPGASEQAYIGVLFVAGAVVCGYVAAKLWTGRDVAADWMLGALTAAGMFVGFVLSRTVGLPGFHESEWELSGIVAMILEAGFVGAAVAALRSTNEHPRTVARARRPVVTSD